MSQDVITGTESVKDALKTNINDDIAELYSTQSAQDLLIAGLSPGGSYTACTSATRPAFAAIIHGHLIGETDTGNFYFGDKDGDLGTAERWVVVPGNRYATADLPGAAYTILTGTIVYDSTLGKNKRYSGGWVLQFSTADFTVSSGAVAINFSTTHDEYLKSRFAL